MNKKEKAIKKNFEFLVGIVPLMGILYLVSVMLDNDWAWYGTYFVTCLYLISWCATIIMARNTKINKVIENGEK